MGGQPESLANWKIISVGWGGKGLLLNYHCSENHYRGAEKRYLKRLHSLLFSSLFSIQLVNNLFLYNSPNYHKPGNA